MSASEWIASASIDAEPDTIHAMNFAIAMPEIREQRRDDRPGSTRCAHALESMDAEASGAVRTVSPRT